MATVVTDFPKRTFGMGTVLLQNTYYRYFNNNFYVKEFAELEIVTRGGDRVDGSTLDSQEKTQIS